MPQFRISLRVKTIVFVSALMVAAAVSLGTVFQRQWENTQGAQFEEQAKERVQAAAAASVYGVLANNIDSLKGVVEGLQTEEKILYVIIREAGGDPLIESGAAPANVSPARLTEINRRALLGETTLVSPLTSPTSQFADLEVAVPIFWERPIEETSAESLLLGIEPEMERVRIGVLQVGFSGHTLLRQQAEVRRSLIRLTMAVTSVAVVLAAVLSGLMITPIRRLAEATRQVAAGDLTIRVPVSTGDEIGALAEAFNLMTNDLRESREELDSYQRTLEFQVAERTDALRMANDELRRINDELAQANQLKSEFLANMSHELRTPLNAIIGFSELLADQVFGTLNAKQMRYVDNVMTSGRHLLNLINEILDLAKVESGKMELRQEPFNPETAITDITNVVRSLAHKKSITIRVEAPQPIGTIVADPKRFKQVLYNLLSNAIKFTLEEGSVTIRATLEPPGPTPKWFQVAVRDTGIGIAEGDQARIFNEFEQVDGTHSREYAGTGLGLALTRKLVELHGGTLRLDSEMGVGSTFSVTLPLVRPEGDAPEVVLAEDRQNGAPLLYVGSASAPTRDALDAFLQEHGFPVHWLQPEDDVLERARSVRPCAVLLDLTGDPGAAYRLWHALRAHPGTAHVPTILFVSPGVEAEGFALCAAAHFTKPVVKEELLAALNNLVPSEQSRPGRILIVDDDPQYLELTADLLKEEGYEVYIARDGAAGIDALAAHAPDIVLLDLMMPEVNGFEVVTHMRSDPETAGVPILIITAKDLTNEDIRILNGHVASIAQKGLFSREDLLREITHAYSQALAQG